MRIKDETINRALDRRLRQENELREASHTPSGKLAASRLGWPLQWQMLKALGVPGQEVDDYTLRKFRRGNHVEDWLIGYMPGVIKTQHKVEYRDTVGFVDAVVDSDLYEHKVGVIPHEVKSIKNAKFNWVIKRNGADDGHKLQAGLYALAMKASHYAIDYVAADDYRILSFVYPVAEVADEIEKIITTFQLAMTTKIVPQFEPREAWQAKADYNAYPEWSNLTEKELQEKIKPFLASKE